MANLSYKEETNRRKKEQIEELLKEMPSFVKEYIIGRENRLSEQSILSYCRQLKYFLSFLQENNSYFGEKQLSEITLADIEKLESVDIEEFTHYLRQNSKTDGVSGANNTVNTYLSALSAFWTYYCKRKVLTSNPVELVDRSKRTKKKIIRLEKGEKEKLVNEIEHGTNLSNRQKAFHEKNKIRDGAIVETFLDTGIRISELVGINIQDINFDEHYIGIYRKGGNYGKAYFSDHLQEVLLEYLVSRETYHPAEDNPALFISQKGNRISVSAVERLVKKYATASLKGKSDIITPHKLRATCATNILRETGNLRLAQIKLGHNSVATTQLYADVDEESLIESRNLLQDKQ